MGEGRDSLPRPQPEPNCLISVRVTPRSSQNRIESDDSSVRIWVTAPPTDGQANEAVCRLVAKKLGLAPSRVSVERGESSRDKVLGIVGLDESTVGARLRSA